MMLAVSVPTGVAVLAHRLRWLFFLSSLLGGLIGPTPRYELTDRNELPANDSDRFLQIVEALTDAQVNRTGDLEVLTNGPSFYPAELEAIRNATQEREHRSLHLPEGRDCGAVYRRADGTRAGWREGEPGTRCIWKRGDREVIFQPLLEAGGKVRWYNWPRWYRLMHMDNRTHRELMIVDGRIGFIGGAGIADQWYIGTDGHPRWRDSAVRIEGEAVYNLQATFAENWLATSGELLTGEAYFPSIRNEHPLVSMVVNSTPTVGGGRARGFFFNCCSRRRGKASRSQLRIFFRIKA